MNENEKRKVFEELLEEYQNVIESEFSYDDGEREAERKAWLNKYNGIKEPLIKDEKIRKAVRAWAEAWNKNKLYKDADNVLSTVDNFVIQFGQTAFIDLEEKKPYTIAELCGEEEECES